MRWYGVASILSTLFWPACAIFADDAFHIDFHHALLGSPQPHTTFFHKPHSNTNASLLYTVSDKAVLGAVNPKDGSALWRQPLAGQPVDNASSAYLIAGERDGQLVSGYDRTVACWDALDGRLIWDYTLPQGTEIGGLQAIPLQALPPTGLCKTLWFWLSRRTLKRIFQSVELLATAADKNGSMWIQALHMAKVVTFDSARGHEISQTSVAVDSEPLAAGGRHAAVACSNFPFLISAERPFKSVKFSLLNNPKVSSLHLDEKGEDIEAVTVHAVCDQAAATHFLLHIKGKTRQWAEVFHVNTKSGDATKAYSLPATEEQSVFTASSYEGTAFFIRSTESEVILYSSESHGQLGRWKKTNFKTSPGSFYSHATAEVVSRGKASYAVRVAEFSTSGDWSLVRNGELQWSRPEMLAYANLAAWDENGAPDALAEELDLESSVNPWTAYIHRLKRHLHDLASLPEYLRSLPDTVLKSTPDADMITRQNLVGTKVVIVTTTRKEVIALDATTPGVLRWQSDLSSYVREDAEMKSVTVSGGRVSVYLSNGSLIVLDANNGSLIENKPGTIPISHLIHIPGSPAPAVIKVGSDGVPLLAEDFPPETALEGNVVVTISPEGKAIGWTVGRNVEKTWTLKPQDGMKIVRAVARAEHDPVASIGRVLGDRSVLYKYISPNIALLLATSQSGALTVYLIDAITGATLHTATHSGVLKSDIPAVISENWYAYTFTTRDPLTSGLSTQLVVSELYESSMPNDRGLLSARTNYSVFSVDGAAATPYVISQSYTVAEPISHLAVSQTAQGITSRQLLATLPNSNAIVGIPREILDPRRPVERDPNATEREEGLTRYMPNLEFDPKYYLTHSREVLGVKEVLSSPSLLESTSVVFAFGHDVFGTTITPSMAFDVLGKGFNRVQLVLTVVALFAGVWALRPLVRKKTVEGRWK
ncbi:PQQ-like domain-containing protein [Cladophialophora immunda]|nr:PQQ-like domain-containing protein [Cladophialophora immunda]